MGQLVGDSGHEGEQVDLGELTRAVSGEFEPTLAQPRDNFQVMAQGKGLSFAFDVAPAAQGWWRPV